MFYLTAIQNTLRDAHPVSYVLLLNLLLAHLNESVGRSLLGACCHELSSLCLRDFNNWEVFLDWIEAMIGLLLHVSVIFSILLVV